MKKVLLTLPLLAMSLCGCGREKITTNYTDVIVDKFMKEEQDIAATWFTDHMVFVTVYYFKLKEYGDMEVEKSDYAKYKIGDNYTWTVTEYK